VCVARGEGEGFGAYVGVWRIRSMASSREMLPWKKSGMATGKAARMDRATSASPGGASPLPL
jgi:hypothetical protein